MLQVDQVLRGQYRIRALVDQDALRVTYRADDIRTRSACIIVELTPPENAGLPPDVIAGMDRHAAALKALYHPGVGRLIDGFAEPPSYYVIAESIEGQALAEGIGTGLAESDALRCAGQLAEALEFCHRRGIVHRDVRPKNIVIRPGGRPVLVNFGLMKLTGHSAPGTVAFIKGWGALPYAPPEQYSAGTDERSDWYSLGATLYHMLTGQPPVSAPERIAGTELRAPRDLNPAISPAAEQLALKALSLNPGERFQNGIQFVSAAQDCAAANWGAPPPPRARSAALVARRGRVRQITALGGIGIVVLIIAALLAMDAVRSTRNPATATAFPVVILATTPQVSDTAMPGLSPPTAGAPQATAGAPTDVAPPSAAAQIDLPAPTAAAASDLPVPPAPAVPATPPMERMVVGQSALGRPLVAYRLGSGPLKRALIGAIHGGYEWNTVDLMSKTLVYVATTPGVLPPQLTLFILPNANPDGYAAGTDRVHGRVNGNNVDLNRNWDYNWQMTATHGTRPVSGGTGPFSEPETRALRDFIRDNGVQAVIFYHSAFTAVFPGADTQSSRSGELGQVMANATGYRYLLNGVPGQITTGDAVDYLSTQGVAAVEVELPTHGDIDWENNRRGVLAFLEWDVPKDEMAPPAPTEPEMSATDVFTYTVQPGDTLSGIAEKFDVNQAELQRINGLTDADFVKVDQELVIPKRR